MGLKLFISLFIVLMIVGTISAGRMTNQAWEITQTGPESNLDITYETISNTQTKFCIEFNTEGKKNTYKQELNNLGKDIKKVPITKVKGDINTKSDLDLEKIKVKEKNCFYISYPMFDDGLSLQIGWNSARIDSQSVEEAIKPSSADSLCIAEDGTLYAAWAGGADDLWFGNSSNGGLNWSTKEIEDGNFEKIGILCKAGDNVSIVTEVAGRLDVYNSTNRGEDWSKYTLVGSNVAFPSCALDSDDTIHCCYQDLGNDLHYINNSGKVDTEINTQTTRCSIELNYSNNAYISTVETVFADDVYVYSAHDGFTTNQTISSTVVGDYSPEIVVLEDDTIYIAYISASDLQFINGSFYNGFSTQEIDADTSVGPDMAVTNEGDIFILYPSQATDNGDVYYSNSSDGGLTWTIRNVAAGDRASSGWADIAYSTFPSSNRDISDTLNFLFIFNSDLYHENITVPVTIAGEGDPPSITIHYPINATYSANVTHLNFTATDDLGNLSSCWWTDDAGVTNTTLTCGTNITGQNWSERTLVIVYANDTGDQLGQNMVNFSVDITLPNGTLLTPADGTNTSNLNQNFSANVSDDQGLSNATLWIFDESGLYNNTIVTGFAGALVMPIGVVVALVDGIYNWFYGIYDMAGNYFETGNFTITVDSTQPTVTLTSPEDGITVYSASQSFNATCSDSGLGLDSGKFYIWDSADNLEASGIVKPADIMNYTFELPDFDTFHWNYECNDSLGNIGFADANRTITYADTIPAINWTETNNCYLIGNLSSGEVITKICNNGYLYMTSPNGSKYRCGVSNAGGWSCQ